MHQIASLCCGGNTDDLLASQMSCPTQNRIQLIMLVSSDIIIVNLVHSFPFFRVAIKYALVRNN